MNPSENNQISFYQKAGELFYTVAAADGVVRKKEFLALKEMVKQEWKDLDDFKDEFGVDAAHQLEIVFDWLDYESLDAETCFQNFQDFYQEHPSLFSEKRKELIMKTAHAIAHSFAGKNKSELIVLGKLQLLFKN